MRPITADNLRGTIHGFFTRQGGVSEGIYDSLNCGIGSRDDAAAVTENRRLVTAHLGAEALVSPSQIHSAEAVHVTGPWEGPRPRADAMVTDRPGIALGILTADCTPVLLADREAGIVGAAHAGWKGALTGVIESAIDRMIALGASRERIDAAIGPVISQRGYEVGPEFMDRFLDVDPDNDRFFAGGTGDRVMFDLPGYCLARLRDAGVASAEWTGHCTWSDKARFFSYRRACQTGEDDYGRLIAAIMV